MIEFILRFVTVSLSLAIALYAANCVVKARNNIKVLSINPESRKRILIGMAIAFAGFFFHQSYWLTWEIAKMKGHFQMKTALEQNAAIPMMIAYSVLNFGFLVILSGWLEITLGRYWKILSGVAVSLIALTGIMFLG